VAKILAQLITHLIYSPYDLDQYGLTHFYTIYEAHRDALSSGELGDIVTAYYTLIQREPCMTEAINSTSAASEYSDVEANESDVDMNEDENAGPPPALSVAAPFLLFPPQPAAASEANHSPPPYQIELSR
jgi:hypothetical protein